MSVIIKKLVCPVCGREMIPLEYGKKSDSVSRTLSGDIYPSEPKQFVIAECLCGCELSYLGYNDVLQIDGNDKE
jgi:hypothetical protein